MSRTGLLKRPAGSKSSSGNAQSKRKSSSHSQQATGSSSKQNSKSSSTIAASQKKKSTMTTASQRRSNKARDEDQRRKVDGQVSQAGGIAAALASKGGSLDGKGATSAQSSRSRVDPSSLMKTFESLKT